MDLFYVAPVCIFAIGRIQTFLFLFLRARIPSQNFSDLEFLVPLYWANFFRARIFRQNDLKIRKLNVHFSLHLPKTSTCVYLYYIETACSAFHFILCFNKIGKIYFIKLCESQLFHQWSNLIKISICFSFPPWHTRLPPFFVGNFSAKLFTFYKSDDDDEDVVVAVERKK